MRAVVLLAVSTAALVPRDAGGSPADVFGFGSRHSGVAGAASASADDFAAAHYNPAGLAFGRGKRLSFGLLANVSNLRANGERKPIAEPLGLLIGAVTPAPLGGGLAERVHLGIGLYLLPSRLTRIIARFPNEPQFAYYDNRTQRAVILPTLAVRVADRLAIGIALNVTGALDGTVQASEGPTRALDARVDEQVTPIVRVNLGVRWRVHPRIDLALVFRQRFDVPFDTVAETEVSGQPIDLNVSANGLFSPTQLVAGAAFGVGIAHLSADATWAQWSAYPGPFVRVESALPLLDPFAGELPNVPYRDTLGVRLGVALDVSRALILRSGYGYEMSPFPADQPGVTNLLDGPKHLVAGGIGLSIGRARVDVHAQAQILGARELVKRVADETEDPESFEALRDLDPDEPGDQITNAGYPLIRSDGQMYSGGVTVELQF